MPSDAVGSAPETPCGHGRAGVAWSGSGNAAKSVRLHDTRLCFARALQARKIPVRVWQQVRRLLAFKQERVQFSLDNPALKCAV